MPQKQRNNLSDMASRIDNLTAAVSAADIQRSEIQRSLGRLEGKLDQVLEFMEDHERRDETRFSALDKRISSVEKKVWYATGLGVAIAFILTKITFGLWFPGAK